MEAVPMPAPTVHFTYARKGPNFIGKAEIPTRNGKIRFAVLVPLVDIRQEFARYLAAKPPEISGDPNVVGNIGQMVERVAYRRANRRLKTAIKAKFGGSIRPYEIAGSASYAHRIAQTAANKAAWGDEVGHEIGLFGFLGKAAKAVGRGVVKAGKVVGKGTVAAAKGVGKGTVAVAKGGLKVGKVVTKNPITRALISVVPYGGAALAIADAARGGSPGAQQAITETNQIASQTGNPIAVQSAAALNAALQAATQNPAVNNAVNFASDNPKSSAGMIAAAVGGVGLLLLLSKKK